MEVKAKSTLAVTAVILFGSLGVNVYLYVQKNGFADDELWLRSQLSTLESQLATVQNQLMSLQDEKGNLENLVEPLESQEVNLKNQITNLQNQLGNLQAENENLQKENANLKHQLYYEREPFLVTRLGVSDVLYNPQYQGKSLIPRLYIKGEVWNIGGKPAYNCSLHVVLYQGSVVANETLIELGNIEPWSYVNVDKNIYYEGERLTNWTITPQWSVIPQFTQR
ncbi:MAG: hypothetical protein N3D85_03555 [Candidatus Bathyarchaeota archaeon]|nr:hypothetical protein [Candidatus Bathyarchaeota archaeon]